MRLRNGRFPLQYPRSEGIRTGTSHGTIYKPSLGQNSKGLVCFTWMVPSRTPQVSCPLLKLLRGLRIVPQILVCRLYAATPSAILVMVIRQSPTMGQTWPIYSIPRTLISSAVHKAELLISPHARQLSTYFLTYISMKGVFTARMTVPITYWIIMSMNQLHICTTEWNHTTAVKLGTICKKYHRI